jgi:hypothetical protein
MNLGARNCIIPARRVTTSAELAIGTVQIVAFEGRRDAVRDSRRRHSRHGGAAAVRVQLSGDYEDGAGAHGRPLVHSGEQADHRAGNGRQQGDVDEFSKRINELRGH